MQLSMEGINAEDEVRGIVPLGASYKFSPERTKASKIEGLNDEVGYSRPGSETPQLPSQ
jgi:hypothetical protein